MLYIPYFEYAAAFFIAIIWLVFYSRHSSFTRSSTYFSIYCLIVFTTAVTDIVSAYTISYPNSVPLWINYLFSAWYLFSYFCSLCLLMLYTDSVAKIGSIRKLIHRGVQILIAVEIIIYLTTPWTHLMIYFDENRKYVAGPLYPVNYVLGTTFVICALFILEKGRAKFSLFQRRSLLYFCLGLFVSNVLQLIFPMVLLGGFNMSILGFFVYIAFENPAYYHYKDTPCFNRDAFYRTMKLYFNSQDDISLVIGHVHDYEEVDKHLQMTQRDNLLRSIAERLSKEFKKNAFLLGPDRYAVIVKNTSEDLREEKRVSARMQTLFDLPFILFDKTVDLEVSVSILPAKYKFSSIDELDGVISLLISLENDPTMSTHEKAMAAIEKKHRRDQVKEAVETAIQNDGFSVYYQPIFNVHTGKFDSAEALVRLIDENLGFVSPDEFIPITENEGLIIPLGEIVLKKVCQFLNRLEKENIPIKYIEVNLSPIQCIKDGIENDILSIINEYHTDLAKINFEITETAEAEFKVGSTIVNNIIEMNKRGIKFSIDDFGSGFSAPDHLFAIPFDFVKIDKYIMWQAMENKNAMVVLKNTFHMIKDLNKTVLVEGVETEEMVKVLEENGCDLLQGYYYSKPVPSEEFVKFIKEKNCA